MVRRGLRFGATLIVASLGVLLPSPATALGQMQDSAPISAGPAITLITQDDAGGSASFASCVRGERDARVVLLMDESRSLVDADPHAVRVDAAQHLVRSWARQVDGSDIDLQVQVMAFFDDGRATTDWRPAGDVDVLVDDLETYRERQDGDQTDYLMGLNSARSALAEEQSSCSAIVWFSDGRLEAGARYQLDDEQVLKPYLDEQVSMAEATDIAEQELCRFGGTADQVRAADINLMAIGLSSQDTNADDFALMRAIAEENSCGAVTPKGSFLLAQDLEELLFAFANVARPEAPTVQDFGVCQGEMSAECLHPFVLDDSISGVSLMLTSETPGLDIVIVPPQGDVVLLPAGERSSTADADTAAVSVERLSERTSNVEMTSSGSWRGQWGVGLVDPESNSAASRSQSSLHLTADVQPTWLQEDSDPLQAGEAGEQWFGLERADGTPIDVADLLGTVAIDISFVTPETETLSIAEALQAETLSSPQQLDLTDVGPGAGSMHYTLQLTTADFQTGDGTVIAGTQLAPVEVQQRAQVLPPLGLPQVGEEIHFGKLLDGQRTEAELAITGPGCVWVDPATVEVMASPAVAAPVEISSSATSAETCVRVEEGASGVLPLVLGTAAPAAGGLTGEVDVHLTALEDSSREVVISRPFAADLDKSPDAVVWWTTVILLVVFAVGIPLALLYLVKWRSSRIPGPGLYGQTFDLQLENGSVVRGGIPQQLRPSDFRDPVDIPRKGTKNLQVGRASLRVSLGWSPLGLGEVHAVVPGQVGVSDTSKKPTAMGAARLPLAVQNHWAVFRDPGGGSATLLYLSGLGRTREAIQDELREIASGLDDDLQMIAESGLMPGVARQPLSLRALRLGSSKASATVGASGAGTDTRSEFEVDPPVVDSATDWDFDDSAVEPDVPEDRFQPRPAPPTSDALQPPPNGQAGSSTGRDMTGQADDWDFDLDAPDAPDHDSP